MRRTQRLWRATGVLADASVSVHARSSARSRTLLLLAVDEVRVARRQGADNLRGVSCELGGRWRRSGAGEGVEARAPAPAEEDGVGEGALSERETDEVSSIEQVVT